MAMAVLKAVLCGVLGSVVCLLIAVVLAEWSEIISEHVIPALSESVSSIPPELHGPLAVVIASGFVLGVLYYFTGRN